MHRSRSVESAVTIVGIGSNEKQTDGEAQPGLTTLLKGMFDPVRLQDYFLNFITFEDDGGGTNSIAKKAAGYHQYHAVNKALGYTLEACGIEAPAGIHYGRFPETEQGDPFRGKDERSQYHRQFGDRRIGVVWHTQGSGKSLSMLFYASKVIRHPDMESPTLLIITDRNDLDDQLFGTFAINRLLLRQTPVQAESRNRLRELLQVASGGVIFTTIQKFLPDKKGDAYPMLSARRNIVVIADEAHRSQYDFIDGFARHMHDALPNAQWRQLKPNVINLSLTVFFDTASGTRVLGLFSCLSGTCVLDARPLPHRPYAAITARKAPVAKFPGKA